MTVPPIRATRAFPRRLARVGPDAAAPLAVEDADGGAAQALVRAHCIGASVRDQEVRHAFNKLWVTDMLNSF